MSNKYLVKVCALLDPNFHHKKHEASKVAPNKYEAKIKKLNKKRKLHNGDTSYRQHKVYK